MRLRCCSGWSTSSRAGRAKRTRSLSPSTCRSDAIAHMQPRINQANDCDFVFLHSAQKLFSTLKVLGASELNLSANQWRGEMMRFDWTPQTGRTHLLGYSAGVAQNVQGGFRLTFCSFPH